MKVYIDREPSSEYFASDLYDDNYSADLVEADMDEEGWTEGNKIVQAYWLWQDRLEKLFEAGKSTRGDKQ